MSTQNRIIVWISAALIVLVVGGAMWSIATGTPTANPARTGTLAEEVSTGDWTRGAKTPVVTLVEYSDFQCPACGFVFPFVEKAAEEYSDRLAFTYRHFPLPQHKNALPAAYAAEASGKQGKFWEMYAKIFAAQETWSDSENIDAVFEGYATELGLNLATFKTDRDSKETKDAVEHDKETGARAGINGTPTFYLNGKRMQSPKSYAELKALIDYAITHP